MSRNIQAALTAIKEDIGKICTEMMELKRKADERNKDLEAARLELELIEEALEKYRGQTK